MKTNLIVGDKIIMLKKIIKFREDQSDDILSLAVENTLNRLDDTKPELAKLVTEILIEELNRTNKIISYENRNRKNR